MADLVAALTAPPVAASRATAALVRSAVRNDFEAQDAAERAAQVLRLQELVAVAALTDCLRNSPVATVLAGRVEGGGVDVGHR